MKKGKKERKKEKSIINKANWLRESREGEQGNLLDDHLENNL